MLEQVAGLLERGSDFAVAIYTKPRVLEPSMLIPWT